MKVFQQAMLSICASIETVCLVAHTHAYTRAHARTHARMIHLASFSRVTPTLYTAYVLHTFKAS